MPGLAAGCDLLAGAAEDHRIAALEPHHAPAGPGEPDHQRVDVVLLAGRPVAGLADQHLLGLAAGEVEHLRRHQIVEQDDVGGLQRAHRAQRQQFRIARARADQRDRALLDASRLPPRRRSSSRSKSASSGSWSGWRTACAVKSCQKRRRPLNDRPEAFTLARQRRAASTHARSRAGSSPRAWRGSPGRTPARRRRSRCRSPAASG